jgi:hypothetical protein
LTIISEDDIIGYDISEDDIKRNGNAWKMRDIG